MISEKSVDTMIHIIIILQRGKDSNQINFISFYFSLYPHFPSDRFVRRTFLDNFFSNGQKTVVCVLFLCKHGQKHIFHFHFIVLVNDYKFPLHTSKL